MEAAVEPRRARREQQGRWIAGVCTGLAAHLGWPVAALRAGMLVLAVANGLGIILYLGLWAVMPLRKEDEPEAREYDVLRMLAFGAVVVGMAALAYAWGWGTFRTSIAPVLAVGLGVAIVWQQSGRSGLRDRRYQLLAAAAGVVLVVAGLALVVVGQIGWQQGLQAVTIVLLIIGGAALVVSPWIVRLLRELSADRRALIREQERTEIATQVHDSVLQTLSLIQRSADDGRSVRQLARAEERRLRTWLYEPTSPHATVSAALTEAAGRIEDDHGVTIDLVVVGDATVTPPTDALVAAAGEAMVNAAKHAGPEPHISVYCEIAEGTAEVFVRDRGAGFDPAAIPEDRHGIRDSIRARIDRVGGTADVRSSSAGTEVRLSVPVVP